MFSLTEEIQYEQKANITIIRGLYVGKRLVPAASDGEQILPALCKVTAQVLYPISPLMKCLQCF